MKYRVLEVVFLEPKPYRSGSDQSKAVLSGSTVLNHKVGTVFEPFEVEIRDGMLWWTVTGLGTVSCPMSQVDYILHATDAPQEGPDPKTGPSGSPRGRKAR